MKLHNSSAVLLFLCASSVAAEKGTTRHLHPNSKKSKKSNDISGVDDLEGYTAVEKAFVGLSPIMGVGSGFVITDIRDEETFGPNPDPNDGRVDMCTCDCKAGADGVGCTGWTFIRIKYSSLLWTEPLSDGEDWAGQMQAFQFAGDGVTPLNFMGEDTRISPGGPTIVNVACTSQDCSDLISGAFRQAYGPVSCLAGIADVDTTQLDTGCAKRCENSDTYTAWLDYCQADEEDKESGFSGYGI
jgi:hypothetical protein